MNQYATKKTLAQGMLDLALLTANVSQLKYLLDVGDLHPYFHILLPLIILSICMQVNHLQVLASHYQSLLPFLPTLLGILKYYLIKPQHTLLQRIQLTLD